MKKEINYPYALDLLQRINGVTVAGAPIADLFLYRGYDLWQAYQTEIFVHAKRFSSDPDRAVAWLRKHARVRPTSALVLFLSFLSLLSALMRRTKVMVYSRDKAPQGLYRCDFRMHEVYAALSEQKVPFVQCLHSVSAFQSLRNAFVSRRLSMYTTGADLLYGLKRAWRKDVHQSIPWESTSVFSKEERQFVDALIYNLRFQFDRTRVRVPIMAGMLRMLGIRQVYLIDDAWHYFDLVCAARQCGVGTIAVQHGHFTKYHVGVLRYSPEPRGDIVMPDKLFVWSEYWKRELQRLGSYYPDGSVVVAGLKESMLRSVNGGSERGIKENTGKYNLLIPYETDVPKSLMRPYIQVLQDSGLVDLYFKPRPDSMLEAQLEEYGLKTKDVVMCMDVSHCAGSVTAVLGTYTTLLYDMIGYRIPVLVAVDVFDYGEGMVRNGLAAPVSSPQEILSVLETVMSEDDDLHGSRIERLYGANTASLIESLTRTLCSVK